MSKFIKKAISVDAELISELIHNAGHNWGALPIWVREHYEKGDIIFCNDCIHINTLEGTMVGFKDDMLIQGINDEIYPCKLDIFNKTYDKIDEEIKQ